MSTLTSDRLLRDLVIAANHLHQCELTEIEDRCTACDAAMRTVTLAERVLAGGSGEGALADFLDPALRRVRELVEQAEMEAGELIREGEDATEAWNTALGLRYVVGLAEAAHGRSADPEETAWLRAWQRTIHEALDLPEGGRTRNDALARIASLQRATMQREQDAGEPSDG